MVDPGGWVGVYMHAFPNQRMFRPDRAMSPPRRGGGDFISFGQFSNTCNLTQNSISNTCPTTKANCLTWSLKNNANERTWPRVRPASSTGLGRNRTCQFDKLVKSVKIATPPPGGRHGTAGPNIRWYLVCTHIYMLGQTPNNHPPTVTVTYRVSGNQ